MTLREYVYNTLNPTAEPTRLSRPVTIIILSIIALSVVSIILESVREFRAGFDRIARPFEVFSVVVFSAEYVLRVWSCVESPSFRSAVPGRLRFIARPMAIIDLLAVLPFYLPFLSVDLRFIRSLRLLRLFRVAKLARYSAAIQTMGRVARAKRPELVASLSVLILLLLISSTSIYYLENEAQPKVFASIPHAMWWTVVTLTTIGYGDLYPITPMGRVLGSIVAVLGIGMFALPTAILGAGFVEDIANRRKKTEERLPKEPRRCPHCGKDLAEVREEGDSLPSGK